ncbi:MAG: GbsR/MarR family transcriptional regulator [Bdellovibrionales bacterium]
MREAEAVSRELEALANEIGEFICFWGFKRIHGRLWTHLYLATEPLDASQIRTRLGVSKALVSLSLHELLEHKVIEDRGKSARGTQTYSANPKVLEVIVNVLNQRERRMLDKIEHCHKSLSGSPTGQLTDLQVVPDRLKNLGDMIQKAQDSLAGIVALASVDFSNWGAIDPQN